MKTATHTSLGARVLLVAGVLSLALGLFFVRAQEPGITFAMGGGFKFTIDSEASYNGSPVAVATWALKDLVPGVDKFFNFSDIKPGDRGENTISLHVNENAWMCLAFSNLTNKENGRNEPEALVDPTGGVNDGELALGMEFFAWHDDGDNVFEVGEQPIFGTSTQSASVVLKDKTYVLADSSLGAQYVASTTRHIGISWCAGNLTVNVPTATLFCDPITLGNEVQTDSMSVDISLRTVPVSEQPTFRCDGAPPPPPPPPAGSGGLGAQIGRFLKCDVLAKVGWPLPTYSNECPNGFSNTNTQTTGRNRPAPARVR